MDDVEWTELPNGSFAATVGEARCLVSGSYGSGDSLLGVAMWAWSISLPGHRAKVSGTRIISELSEAKCEVLSYARAFADRGTLHARMDRYRLALGAIQHYAAQSSSLRLGPVLELAEGALSDAVGTRLEAAPLLELAQRAERERDAMREILRDLMKRNVWETQCCDGGGTPYGHREDCAWWRAKRMLEKEG